MAQDERDLTTDALLFPVSAKIPGGVDRRTSDMMREDLKAARKKWIEEAKTEEREGRAEKFRLPEVPERHRPVRRLPLQSPHLHHQLGAGGGFAADWPSRSLGIRTFG